MSNLFWMYFSSRKLIRSCHWCPSSHSQGLRKTKPTVLTHVQARFDSRMWTGPELGLDCLYWRIESSEFPSLACPRARDPHPRARMIRPMAVMSVMQDHHQSLTPQPRERIRSSTLTRPPAESAPQPIKRTRSSTTRHCWPLHCSVIRMRTSTRESLDWNCFCDGQRHFWVPPLVDEGPRCSATAWPDCSCSWPSWPSLSSCRTWVAGAAMTIQCWSQEIIPTSEWPSS